MLAHYINKIMKPLFEEKQRFTQWWLWLIIVSAAAVVIGLFAHGMFVQLVLGKPWGNEPMSDDSLIVFSILIISSMVIMLLIFFNAVLEIVVDRGSVSYRYFPLLRRWRRIERETIRSFEVKTEYMQGYGFHTDLRGNKRINVKGYSGIELTMLDGKRLYLGTQKPGDFLNALNKMKNGSED